MQNLADMFERRVAATPDREAVTFRDRTVTWAELRGQAARIAALIERSGLGRGDVVAIYVEHSLGQLSALLAASMADCVFTLVNQHASHDQLIGQISDSGAALVIAGDRLEGAIARIAADRRVPILLIDAFGEVVSAPGEIEVSPGDDTWRRPTAAIPVDVACLMYTSGSSGRPKGVVTPHRTLLDGARIVSGVLSITKDDVLLCVLQFGFDYGFNQILSVIHTGARAVILSYLLPPDLYAAIERHQATGLAAVPSMWPAVLNERYRSLADPSRLKSLRYITSAGGPHSENLLQRLTAFFPSADVQIFYGLTESFRSTHLPAEELLTRIGSIGKAVPEVEILVLNESGEPCAQGEKGVLHHRGAFVTYGYLNNPELTDAVFIERRTRPGMAPERIVRSGDLVSVDAEGFIYFHGRIDQMIKSRGYRVSPSEVEIVASSFSGVEHVAVFGLPDDELGQAICLAIDAPDEVDIDTKAYARHLAKNLSYYAAPKHILRVPRIPKTANGKIDYTALRAAALDQGRASS